MGIDVADIHFHEELQPDDQLLQRMLIHKGNHAAHLTVQHRQHLPMRFAEPMHRIRRISVALRVVRRQNIRVQRSVATDQLLLRGALQAAPFHKFPLLLKRQQKLRHLCKIVRERLLADALPSNLRNALHRKRIALLQHFCLHAHPSLLHFPVFMISDQTVSGQIPTFQNRSKSQLHQKRQDQKRRKI